MKRKMCSIALLLLPFCHISYSQQTSQTVVIQKNTPKPSNKAVISQSTNSPSASTNQNTYPMTLSSGTSTQHSTPGTNSYTTVEQINHTIAQIQGKIDYVNAHPQAKLEAEQNGWFTEMKQVITELENKKKALLNQ